MFLRTYAMKKAGMAGGEAGQYQTCMERAKSNPNIIFCGIDVGEIRKSTDGGITWILPKMKGLRGGGISSVAIHPTNSNIIFAYGHYINYNASSLTGVYRSINGGDEWEMVLKLNNIEERDLRGSHHQIEINISNPQIIYCGSYKQGFYKSTDGGTTWIKKTTEFDNEGIRWVRIDPNNSNNILVATDEGKIFRSTNGGEIFSLVGHGISPGSIIGALVYHPTKTNIVYAVKSNDRLYKSIDGGINFIPVTNTHKKGVFLFDISPADPNKMYLMTSNTYAYYSNNGEEGPWNLSTINNSLTFIGSLGNWVGNASTGMSCHPTNPKMACVTIGTRVYQTTDGGVSYNPTNNGNPGFAHGWGGCPAMFFDKNDKNKMWTFNLDFGTVGTTDNWDTAKRYGGDDTFFEDGVAWGSSQFGGVVLPNGRIIVIGGGYFNNTIKATDDGIKWKIVEKNTLTLVDETGPGAPHPVKLYYAETIELHPQNNNIIYCANLRSLDGGNTWAKMGDGSYHILGMYNKNGDVIYAKKFTDRKQRKNGGIIYKSSDKGNTWIPLPDAGVDIGYVWNGPSGFAVDPLKEDRFYALSSSKIYSIFRYDSGIWTEIIPKPNREPKSLAIDPNSPRIIYCSLDGKGEESVYKSEDYGNTWKSIQYNLPMVGSGHLVVSPHDSTLYFNSGIGMWRLKPYH